MARIIIGSTNEKLYKQLNIILTSSGHNIITQGLDSYDLLRKIRSYHPDLCIIDNDLKGMNTYTLSESIIEESLSAVIVLCKSYEVSKYSKLKDNIYFSAEIKSSNYSNLQLIIPIMVKSCNYVRNIEQKLRKLETEIKNQKIINQAKRLLIKYEAFSEEEAHKYILKKSMEKRLSKEKFADEIVIKYKNI